MAKRLQEYFPMIKTREEALQEIEAREELMGLFEEWTEEQQEGQILPNDTVRIADENTLLTTDIIVELEDGSMANVEIQKIGYAFPESAWLRNSFLFRLTFSEKTRTIKL